MVDLQRWARRPAGVKIYDTDSTACMAASVPYVPPYQLPVT